MAKASSHAKRSKHGYNLRPRHGVKKATSSVASLPIGGKNGRQKKRSQKQVPPANPKPAPKIPPKDRKVLQAKRQLPPPVAVRASRSLANVFAARQRTPTTTLAELKGIDEIQEALKSQVIWPFASVDNARLMQMDIPRGILLTGVPGTGKTALADAIVSEIRESGREVNYYEETGACLDCLLGESERNLRQLFQTAKDNAPSVIFLDEIDGLGRKRANGDANGAMHTVLTCLLTQINELPQGEVLLIAATNCSHLCDPALIRKGRFDVTLHIPLPSPPARKEILRWYFSKKELKLNESMMNEIVKRTQNSTGMDLKSLVASVYSSFVNRMYPNGSWKDMSKTELKKKLKEVRKIDMNKDVRPILNGMVKVGVKDASEE